MTAKPSRLRSRGASTIDRLSAEEALCMRIGHATERLLMRTRR